MSRRKTLLQVGRPPQDAVTLALARLVESLRQRALGARHEGDREEAARLARRHAAAQGLLGDRQHRTAIAVEQHLRREARLSQRPSSG
jgi:hypothetical protein